MDLKQAHAELSDLAQQLAQVPIPEALELSHQILVTAKVLAEQAPVRVAQEESEDAAVEIFLDTELERFPKDAAWWLPPHNIALNQTLLGGYNLWRFSILPHFPKRSAYREDLQGIVIHPIWQPLDNRTMDVTADVAKRILAAMHSGPTVQEDVRKELAWMETQFSLRIPEAIQAKLIKDALPTARRRWGINRLRVKNRLVPLDGSKPYDLGAFE